MSVAATVIVLAVVWAVVTGGYTLANLLLGGGVAALALLLLRDSVRRGRRLGRVGNILSLAALFLRELLVSAVTVARWTLRPNLRDRMAPAIVAVPLAVTSDLEITLLANLITLTPGTLSIDVSADRKFLYVHALDCRDPEALKRSIAEGFERRIIEVTR